MQVVLARQVAVARMKKFHHGEQQNPRDSAENRRRTADVSLPPLFSFFPFIQKWKELRVRAKKKNIYLRFLTKYFLTKIVALTYIY